jgi:hypothetical protein
LKIDVEKDIEIVRRMAYHDIFHCYGLLYHVSNPEEFLFSLKGKCGLLLLETCVSNDFRDDGPHLVKEDHSNPTQAISGTGCRPTRAWIFEKLKSVFPHVYVPLSQPDHDEFPKNWNSPLEDRSKLIRAIFIASTDKLRNEYLTEDLIKEYK